MLVAVRDIAARCCSCGKTDFKLLGAGELRLTSVMACSACGERMIYRDLLEQIGEEAIRRANDAIARLKRRPKKK
jgi:predicted RNA-binding Zn-ribbon protein involved in translation (DUF1610 family)